MSAITVRGVTLLPPCQVTAWAVVVFLSSVLFIKLDKIWSGLPLLATIRTAREGGLAPLPAEQYAALCRAVCRTGAADLLDVELSAGEQTACALRDAAHAAGMAVVFSSHDFDKTPDAGAMTRRLCRMGALGADLAELAVGPRAAAAAAALRAALAALHQMHL